MSTPAEIADEIMGGSESSPTHEILWQLIHDLTKEDACSFDHHGHCQAHGWFDKDCPHGRAQKMLRERGEE